MGDRRRGDPVRAWQGEAVQPGEMRTEGQVEAVQRLELPVTLGKVHRAAGREVDAGDGMRPQACARLRVVGHGEAATGGGRDKVAVVVEIDRPDFVRLGGQDVPRILPPDRVKQAILVSLNSPDPAADRGQSGGTVVVDHGKALLGTTLHAMVEGRADHSHRGGVEAVDFPVVQIAGVEEAGVIAGAAEAQVANPRAGAGQGAGHAGQVGRTTDHAGRRIQPVNAAGTLGCGGIQRGDDADLIVAVRRADVDVRW